MCRCTSKSVKNYLKLGNNYSIGYRSRVRVRYRDHRVRGIRTFRSPVFSLLGAKVPIGNFRSEERKYRGAKSLNRERESTTVLCM